MHAASHLEDKRRTCFEVRRGSSKKPISAESPALLCQPGVFHSMSMQPILSFFAGNRKHGLCLYVVGRHDLQGTAPLTLQKTPQNKDKPNRQKAHTPKPSNNLQNRK